MSVYYLLYGKSVSFPCKNLTVSCELIVNVSGIIKQCK